MRAHPLSIFYNIGERRLGFQKHWGKSAFFETPETFIVRMDVWVDGDKEAPFIILKFEFSNKQNSEFFFFRTLVCNFAHQPNVRKIRTLWQNSHTSQLGKKKLHTTCQVTDIFAHGRKIYCSNANY